MWEFGLTCQFYLTTNLFLRLKISTNHSLVSASILASGGYVKTVFSKDTLEIRRSLADPAAAEKKTCGLREKSFPERLSSGKRTGGQKPADPLPFLNVKKLLKNRQLSYVQSAKNEEKSRGHACRGPNQGLPRKKSSCRYCRGASFPAALNTIIQQPKGC